MDGDEYIEAIERTLRDWPDDTPEPNYRCVVCSTGQYIKNAFHQREHLWCDWCNEVTWFEKL